MQNERTRKKTRTNKTGIIKKHIENNLKYYILVTIIFIIGVIIGVLYINNSKDIQAKEISEFINDFINKIKDDASIDYIKLLSNCIRQNLIFAILLWFAGLTVIGIVAVYGIVAYKGFCLRL